MSELIGCESTHGNPFRYCACGWIEPQISEGAKRTNDIENRFGYHKPDEKKIKEHELVRDQVKGMAHYWSGNLPEGREKALAITKLEEAMFWANAAIARN